MSTASYLWYYVFPLAIMARTTSVWLTVAIAAQRCIAVTMPLKVKLLLIIRPVQIFYNMRPVFFKFHKMCLTA